MKLYVEWTADDPLDSPLGVGRRDYVGALSGNTPSARIMDAYEKYFTKWLNDRVEAAESDKEALKAIRVLGKWLSDR